MTKKISEHSTAVGDILFMAAARKLKNKFTGKEEFSIRIKVPTNDACVTHLRNINDKAGTDNTDGTTTLNFKSDFAPLVVATDGTELTGRDIPFFNGQTDTGQAAVLYNVIDYGDSKIVRLRGIKLTSLELAPRESNGLSNEEVLNRVRNLG